MYNKISKTFQAKRDLKLAIQEEYGVSSNHEACKLEMTKFLFTQQSLTIEQSGFNSFFCQKISNCFSHINRKNTLEVGIFFREINYFIY